MENFGKMWKILEKCGIFLKNGRFSGRIWPDWGNTTRADRAGLGSKGLNIYENIHAVKITFIIAYTASYT